MAEARNILDTCAESSVLVNETRSILGAGYGGYAQARSMLNTCDGGYVYP